MPRRRMTMPLIRMGTWHRTTEFVFRIDTLEKRKEFMSNTNKRVQGKRQAVQNRAKWSASKYTYLQGQHRHKGALLAMTFGLAMAVAIVVGLALLLIIGHGEHIVSASGGGPNAPVGYGSLNHPKGACGNEGQAPCPAPDPGWFAVPSETQGVLTAAIASSTEFKSMQAQYGYMAMDTPMLVHAYNIHTGNSYYDDDHYVLTVPDASGMRNGIFDFVYDRANQRMRFSSYGVITAADPHSRMAFPFMSSSVAIAELDNKCGLNLKPGMHSE